MKKYKRYLFSFCKKSLVFLFCTASCGISCSHKTHPLTESYPTNSPNGKPDYTQLFYWAAHPWKNDPSDSIPAQLMQNLSADSSVDVFFLYPTSLTDKSDTSWNASINDRQLNEKTDFSSILYQASVFNKQCRVFAPRYRQAHIRSFFLPDSVSKPYFDIAYADIKAAFMEYLARYNQGRPIIIASHSQGTLHAARLLKEFFENKPLKDQLVCAYLLGMPVSEHYYTQLQACKDSLATGCFVSWRTFKAGYEGTTYIKNESDKMVVTNPLSWTSDTLYMGSVFNKGGIAKNFEKVIPHIVSAQVHGNILWASKPDVPGKMLLTTKNYHIGDINLFYLNIRENVTQRIRVYRQLHPNR